MRRGDLANLARGIGSAGWRTAWPTWLSLGWRLSCRGPRRPLLAKQTKEGPGSCLLPGEAGPLQEHSGARRKGGAQQQGGMQDRGAGSHGRPWGAGKGHCEGPQLCTCRALLWCGDRRGFRDSDGRARRSLRVTEETNGEGARAAAVALSSPVHQPPAGCKGLLHRCRCRWYP